MNNKRLCYVEDNFAYFTNDLENQWGDDWDDRPYEDNAGLPYNHNNQIEKIAFDCELQTPAEFSNTVSVSSGYSVEDINRGDIPWLSGQLSGGSLDIKIYAGITLKDFIKIVDKIGGEVFLQAKENDEIT